ncbi:uncharacterized protein LAESUDRAFT_662372 [Laetiporus sulphureus 93-53]|uniref:RNA-dependent RNA polymerase n=1 Tax=Laetiporus sulphureus 93-53 TaxID=1314785 RepID=A0A165C5A4_9APHY|nr:uncharacterized protein LAESUDRAFT_662372 [Laetiporus sulphureus 93-53]KZT02230.1 hypothetical protein LAESUDRAFT_662372 [Laetiporus sulphureus 93-53]
MGLPPSKTATLLVSSVTPRAEIAHAQPTATSSLTQIRRNDPLGSVKASKGPAPEAAAVKPSAASTSKGFTASASAIPSVLEGVQIIAHSKEVQKMMDSMQIAWGVQYEIARGICHGYWTWDDVTSSKLNSLRGSNVMAAPRVARVMLGHNLGRAIANDHPLWTELDREQDALQADPSRGLGLQGEWHGDANWYGGRIQQVSRLVKTESGSYKLVLERMLKRKSNRVARFLGSRRVLQVSVPDKQVREPEVTAVRLFFSQKFVLCGRVFVPFAAKDGKVYMMETNEDYERTPDRRADKNRMSLEDFVDWHNPLDLNGHQPITKWITRFDLGLSTSVPVLRFQGKGVDVFEIPDQCTVFRKPPTECIFTDGCGFMNGAALAKIAKHLGYSERPTVVQGRFGGAKGLWALHPKDQEPDALPRIWTRPSQQKIRYAELGLAQLIFDLVSPPRVTAPSRLSKLTIMNLSHNGVPDHLFVDLMREGLQKEMDALTTWSSEQDLLLLWNAVNQVGHVTMSIIRRQASGAARILGFGRAQDREDWEGDDGDDGENLDDILTEKSRNESGGEPVSAAAALMELLQAGFHPMKLEQLYEKLRQIVAARLEEFIKEFRIVVPQSAEAFIIPDPIGVLEEGQIQFRASQNLKDPLEDASPTVITGDVLIYRNPARVPSDIQKVTAVNHPALAAYINVIVLPVKGHRSLANLLAGGVSSADVCVCIYDANLVKNFHTPAINDPPADFMEKNFESEGSIEQVHDLHERLQAVAASISQRELQEVLISGLSDAPVGLYSIFHENAAYAYGYDSPQTLRAAYMFNVVLDSRKTGHRVLNDIFQSDQRKYGRKKPLCMRGVEAETSIYGTMGNPIPRSHGLPPFVLDELLRAGKKLQDAHLAHFEQLKKTSPENRDEDLTRPFEEAAAQAHPVLKNDLDLIDEHVRMHVRQWQQLSTLQLDGSPAKPRVSPKKFPSKPAGKARPKTEKDRLYQRLGESFVRGPDGLHILSALPGAVHTLIASAAYRANVKFAFRFAFRDLCRIKAEASGLIAFTPSFAELMAMPSSAVRVLAQMNQDAPHL